MTKVLIATDKPFAPVAVKGIREIVEAQGYELVLLEKYTSPEELIAAVEAMRHAEGASHQQSIHVNNHSERKSHVT